MTNENESEEKQGNERPLPPIPENYKDMKDEELFYMPPDVPYFQQEGIKEKAIRKTKENPFVPLGCLFTAGVLCRGLWTLKTGDRKKTQKLMRLRVGGQAFAIFAMLAGVWYNSIYKVAKPGKPV